MARFEMRGAVGGGEGRHIQPSTSWWPLLWKSLWNVLTGFSMIAVHVPCASGASLDWTDFDRTEFGWTDLDWANFDVTDFDWPDFDWTDSDWTDSDYVEFDWTDFDWTTFDRVDTSFDWCVSVLARFDALCTRRFW